MKIVADDKIPFLKGALEPFAEVVYIPGGEISRDIVSDADALLIRTRTRCDRKLLEGTGIKFIGTATIGYDHIDTGFCEENNISWTNAPGCNSGSVQQYIASALVTIAAHENFHPHEKTIGIIGAGNVGSKVARLATILGMRVLLNDPPRERREGSDEFTEIGTILSEADIVTLHVPLTRSGEERTYHLFDESTFGRMKRGAWFINSSRGEVAETMALKHALESSQLGGAVIDVWEKEPCIDLQLLSGVFLATPHIAGYSTDGKANGTAMAVNALCRFFNLPVENWYPSALPGPALREIVVDGASGGDEEILKQIILHSYDIKADDLKLRNSPSDFEKLRGGYPVRREFPSYSVRLENSSVEFRRLVEKLGFEVYSA